MKCIDCGNKISKRARHSYEINPKRESKRRHINHRCAGCTDKIRLPDPSVNDKDQLV